MPDVKITKFGCVVDARTVQFSSLICLIHPYDLLISKGVSLSLPSIVCFFSECLTCITFSLLEFQIFMVDSC